jgi:hypothetical protein
LSTGALAALRSRPSRISSLPVDNLADRHRPGEPDLHADGQAGAAPIILGYFVFIYWLFSGKVREGDGYH